MLTDSCNTQGRRKQFGSGGPMASAGARAYKGGLPPPRSDAYGNIYPCNEVKALKWVVGPYTKWTRKLSISEYKCSKIYVHVHTTL